MKTLMMTLNQRKGMIQNQRFFASIIRNNVPFFYISDLPLEQVIIITDRYRVVHIPQNEPGSLNGVLRRGDHFSVITKILRLSPPFIFSNYTLESSIGIQTTLASSIILTL